jgi:hypothetical protein
MAETYDEFLARLKRGAAAPPQETPEVSPQAAPVVAPEAAPVERQPVDDTDTFLQKFKKEPVQPTAIPAAAREPVAQDYGKFNYSESDLTKDEFFIPIQEYMVDRFGAHMQDAPKEDIVSQYVNNMRGFAGGNSVRALNEITYLNSVTDNPTSMSKAGQAYEIFDNMQSLSGDTSWSEKGDILLDYGRSAVLDPINLLGLGIGKVASGTGFKATSQIAMYAAKKAFKEQIAQNATREAAQKVAENVFKATAQTAITETNLKIAQRQAIERAATTTFQRMTTKTALKESAVVGVFESAVAAGTDYLYQDAMLRTKVQDEYNIYQTGLAAVAGLVAGGLSAMASNMRTGASGLVAPMSLNTSTKGSKAVTKLVNQVGTVPPGPPGTISPPAGNWLKDIAKGVELRDQDTDFFITMLLGKSDKGLKGLAEILVEDGYGWVPRNPDDKVSNWIGDIIKESDPQDAQQFLDDFVKATGITMDDGKALTVDAFADTFKRKMSDSGKVLNAASQVAKILGKKVEDVTGDDYANFILNGIVPTSTSWISTKSQQIGATASRLLNEDLPDFQNNIIRLMVSNLSTTALNVAGYTATTAMNSASDVVRAALLGGAAGISMVYNPAQAKSLGITAMSLVQNQMTKAKNILDVNTTYDTFLQYSQVRPDVMRQLTNIDMVPSGGLDMRKPLITMKIEKGVDFVQRLNLVNAQDGYTKSIEFTTQLDRLLRRPPEEGGFGMSWNEFFSQPNHPTLMQSQRFVASEAIAVDETLKATFSKSYKGRGLVGEVATIIEDARKIPGIGLLVPFGRFFNNTVATAYNMTAVLPFVAKQFGGQRTKVSSEILAKGMVTWGVIWALSEREKEYMDLGLAWNEEIDPETGAVTDQRYAFPYGALKAIARGWAHLTSDTETPAELYTQVKDQFVGQLTRQLGDAGTGFANIGKAIFSDEGKDLATLFKEMTGTIASQAISGITRPLEPVNTIAGLARDEQFYTPDRKQGVVWFNNSSRYFDQMIALGRGENIAPPKFNAVGGKPRVQASRLISTTREDRLTNTERVMNMVSRPGYKENMASMSDAADNRYNQIFNNIVEDGAGKLYANPQFKEGTLEVRQALVNNLLESAKKTTLSYMGRIAANSGDDTLLKMIEISGKDRLKVDRVIASLNMNKELKDMSDAELDTVATALRFREEFILNQGQ